ncbi:MAG TPA: hypothetical protein VD790_06830 [Thermoleophilaceae bacterium]|nr:hypothetical protein [Thermoleophilaceae bacterium]
MLYAVDDVNQTREWTIAGAAVAAAELSGGPLRYSLGRVNVAGAE